MIYGNRRVGMLAAALFALLLSTSPSSVAAEDAHWQFQMTVDAPAATGAPFVVNLTAALVGPKPGIILQPGINAVFGVVAIKPDGTQRVLTDKSSVSGEITGGVQHIRLSYQPEINGVWTFQLWQHDGPRDILLDEQKVGTDKVFIATATDPQFVADIETDPTQLVTGEPARVTIVMTGTPPASRFTLHVAYVANDGIHDIGDVVNPGPGGTTSLEWTPTQAGDGVLLAGDRSVSVTIIDVTETAPNGAEPGAAITAETTDDDAETP